MTRYEYACNRCGVESHVDVAKDATVYEACNALIADHTKSSPECTGDLSTIHLTDPLIKS